MMSSSSSDLAEMTAATKQYDNMCASLYVLMFALSVLPYIRGPSVFRRGHAQTGARDRSLPVWACTWSNHCMRVCLDCF